MIPLLAPRARVLCPDYEVSAGPTRQVKVTTVARDVLALLDALGLERVDRWV
jgi:pimeloyl-ACP methyl ester carboxylesterase